MFSRFGITELLVIFGILLLLFGAKKLPELAESLGKGIKRFRNAQKDMEGDDSSKP